MGLKKCKTLVILKVEAYLSLSFTEGILRRNYYEDA
jgi:hypothetical protein